MTGPGLAKTMLPPAVVMVQNGLNETANMFERLVLEVSRLERDNARLVLENGQVLDELHGLRTLRDRALDHINNQTPETLARLLVALDEVTQ